MNYIFSIVIGSISMLLLGLFGYYMHLDRKKLDSELENYIVQTLPKIFLFIFVMWLIPTLLIVLLNIFIVVGLWVNIFLCILYAYLSGVLISYRERVEVLGEKIIYTPPFFGKSKIYDFNQITKIIKQEDKLGMCSCKIYIEDKMVFSIENTLKNGIRFLNKTIAYNIQIEERRR